MSLISLLARARYPVQIKSLLDNFYERGGVQTIEMFTSAIFAQRYNKDYKTAETLLEELRSFYV